MSSISRIRRENYEISKRLNKENNEIYTDFIVYLRVSILSDKEQEEVIGDLLPIFLECQGEGKSIDTIFDGDMKKYADDIILAVNTNKNLIYRLKEFMIMFIEVLCIMTTINVLVTYLPKVLNGYKSFDFEYNLAMFINMLIFWILAYLVVIYIGKTSVTKNKEGKYFRYIFAIGFALLVAVSVVIIRLFSNKILFSVNIIYVVILLLIYWGYKFINRGIIR